MRNLSTYDQFINESKLQNDYRDFFSKLLELYNVKSPSEFKDNEDIAKKFYKDIEEGWSTGNGLTKYGKKLMEIEKLEDLVEESMNLNEDIDLDDMEDDMEDRKSKTIDITDSLTEEEAVGAELIDSPNEFNNRYRLKDGRIVDVTPDQRYLLVEESVEESDDEFINEGIKTIFGIDKDKSTVEELVKKESLTPEEESKIREFTEKIARKKYVADAPEAGWNRISKWAKESPISVVIDFLKAAITSNYDGRTQVFPNKITWKDIKDVKLKTGFGEHTGGTTGA